MRNQKFSPVLFVHDESLLQRVKDRYEAIMSIMFKRYAPAAIVLPSNKSLHRYLDTTSLV